MGRPKKIIESNQSVEPIKCACGGVYEYIGEYSINGRTKEVRECNKCGMRHVITKENDNG